MFSKWLFLWVVFSVIGALVGWFAVTTLFRIPLFDYYGITTFEKFAGIILAVLAALFGMWLGQALALSQTSISPRAWLGESFVGGCVGAIVGVITAFPLTLIFAFILGNFVPVSDVPSGLGGLALLFLGALGALLIAWILLGAGVGWGQAHLFANSQHNFLKHSLVPLGGWIVGSLFGIAALLTLRSIFELSDGLTTVSPIIWSACVLGFSVADSVIRGIWLQRMLGPLPFPIRMIGQWQPNRAVAATVGVVLIGGIFYIIWQTGLSPCSWIDLPLKRSGCIRTWTATNRLYANLVFSQDGASVLSGLQNKTVGQWNIESGTETGIFQARDYLSSDTAISTDGKFLAVGLYDGGIQIWRMENRQTVRIIETGVKVRSVTFSPDSKMLAVTHEHEDHIQLYRSEDGALLKILGGRGGEIRVVAFSPDGKLLAAGPRDEPLQLWDVTSGAMAPTTEMHVPYVSNIAFSPDGSQVALREGLVSDIRVWQVRDDKPGQILKAPRISATDVQFSPDGTMIAATAAIGQVALWRIQDATLIRVYGAPNTYRSVGFCPCGTLLAMSRWDAKMELWELRP